MKFPKVSFVICTYNAKNLVKKCLDSIFMQDYPKNMMEVICVDGGSIDSTLSLLKSYKVKVIHNKNGLPEGKGMGKYLGYKAAKGEYIAFIDQDNEIQGKNWLKEMIFPLEKDKKIFGSACILLRDKKDTAINRYVSLVGTDPFAAYRSLDGVLGLGKIKLNDEGKYFSYNITLKNIIITGGNCFIYRKKILDKIGGYSVDTDVIYSIAEKNMGKLAIPKHAKTHHFAAISAVEFIKKKIAWSRNYFLRLNRERKFMWVPNNKKERIELYKNILMNLTILPNLYIAAKNYIKSREIAWMLHPAMAFIITLFYGLNYLIFSI